METNLNNKLNRILNISEPEHTSDITININTLYSTDYIEDIFDYKINQFSLKHYPSIIVYKNYVKTLGDQIIDFLYSFREFSVGKIFDFKGYNEYILSNIATCTNDRFQLTKKDLLIHIIKYISGTDIAKNGILNIKNFKIKRKIFNFTDDGYYIEYNTLYRNNKIYKLINREHKKSFIQRFLI